MSEKTTQVIFPEKYRKYFEALKEERKRRNLPHGFKVIACDALRKYFDSNPTPERSNRNGK